MLDRDVIAAAEPHARRLGVELAGLLAVVEVESDGVVSAKVGNRREPLIRFEGHYFDRRLSGEKRAEARRLGLAHPKAGAVKNPRSQAARWRMVLVAIDIDRQAALESVSFGVGQVMGAHWDLLGFSNVDALVDLARSGISGQIELMARYIEHTGLQRALKRRDWAAFARGYNGPAYRKYAYHTKMAAAFRRYAKLLTGDRPPPPSASGMLRLGSKGAKVRELQTLLLRGGYAVRVDGDYGTATERAVRAHQAAEGLEEDGVVGPQTWRTLERFRQGPQDNPGKQALLDINEVKAGAMGGVGGGLTVETARAAVENISSQVSYLPGLEWVSAVLGVIAAALVIGGLIYAIWGWWKSSRTEEAPGVIYDEANADDVEVLA